MNKNTKINEQQDQTAEEKLIALARLQEIYSQIDRIKTLRGELPLEVLDLEDEIAGMETRLNNYEQESKRRSQLVAGEKAKISHAQGLIENYQGQLSQVKNNREYDNLTKEIEFQGLEIELSEKHLSEYAVDIQQIKDRMEALATSIEDRKIDLSDKKAELEKIKNETKQEEEELRSHALQLEEKIEDRLLKAFHRIREGARNGLAVVRVDRDACGGCFNKIPAQKQLDIRLHKKILVCEYCGRIMVDPELIDQATQG